MSAYFKWIVIIGGSFDNQPLKLIAVLAGGSWSGRCDQAARVLAKEQSETGEDASTPGAELLSYLVELIGDEPTLPVLDAHRSLLNMDGE